MTKVKIGSNEYNYSEMNDNCKSLADRLQSIHIRINEANNMVAILTKAKRAYISDLKSEMLSAKAGFDFDEV